MKIISDKRKLIRLIQNEKNLGFVPTMGALHLGHISLINKSISQSRKTLVTIFINKPQFNKKSDLKNYPRSLNSDISKLRKLKINYLYLPKNYEIYQNGKNRKIKINSFGKKLCGKYRPGHFKAVVDVIDRFIKIIKPRKIYLGEKDMQQLKIIEDFVKNNHNETKVIGCKTVREKNGVPYSSRNFLLTYIEKIIASNIYKLILRSKKKLIKDNRKLNRIRKEIIMMGVKKIDYIEIVDINKIIKPYNKAKKNRIFLAYHLGKVRLIDNV